MPLVTASCCVFSRLLHSTRDGPIQYPRTNPSTRLARILTLELFIPHKDQIHIMPGNSLLKMNMLQRGPPIEYLNQMLTISKSNLCSHSEQLFTGMMVLLVPQKGPAPTRALVSNAGERLCRENQRRKIYTPPPSHPHSLFIFHLNIWKSTSSAQVAQGRHQRAERETRRSLSRDLHPKDCSQCSRAQAGMEKREADQGQEEQRPKKAPGHQAQVGTGLAQNCVLRTICGWLGKVWYSSL